VKIRKIQKTTDDFKALADFLIYNFGQEHNMGKLGANQGQNIPKGALWVTKCIEHGAWIAEEDGKIIGSIGIYKTTPWYSDTEYYTDGWFYVLPEHRLSKVGSSLLGMARIYAEEQEKPLVVNIFNMDDTENKIKALQKMGLKLIGATFMAGD